MAKNKLSDSEQVTEYISRQEPTAAATMQAIREAILSVSQEISEHIKWNAPAFYFNGAMAAFDAKDYKRDIVVYNLRKNGDILLVFPTGSTINNTSGLLEGSYADGRRMVTISSVDDLNAKVASLKEVLRILLNQVNR